MRMPVSRIFRRNSRRKSCSILSRMLKILPREQEEPLQCSQVFSVPGRHDFFSRKTHFNNFAERDAWWHRASWNSIETAASRKIRFKRLGETLTILLISRMLSGTAPAGEWGGQAIAGLIFLRGSVPGSGSWFPPKGRFDPPAGKRTLGSSARCSHRSPRFLDRHRTRSSPR